MAKAFADDLGVDAGLQAQGGMGVAQVVQADLGQHGLLDGLAKVAADALGIQRPAILGRKDEAGLDPVFVLLLLLVELSRRLGLEHLDGARGEGDGAPALGRLGL